MKKLVLVTAIAASTFGAVSTAQAEVTTSANMNVTTDYRFRGLSQTNNDFALQGGFDVDFGNGFYLGNWNSNVSLDAGNVNLEMDFYGGYAGELANGVSYDTGLLYYYYPNATNVNTRGDLDTLEIYGSVGYAGFTAGLSYALSEDYFGLTSIGTVPGATAANGGNDLGGSTYISLGYEYPVSEALSFAVSYGVTNFDKAVATDTAGNLIDSYHDYSVGLTYAMGKYNFGAAIIGTNDDGEFVGGKDQSDADLILTFGTSF